jgi:hypothetical protein
MKLKLLASAFALHHFANSLGEDMVRFSLARMSKEGKRFRGFESRQGVRFLRLCM